MLNEFWVMITNLSTENLYNMTVLGFFGIIANFIFLIYLNRQTDKELEKH
jgi:hypothetical protein